jgi:hypothetical protein
MGTFSSFPSSILYQDPQSYANGTGRAYADRKQTAEWLLDLVSNIAQVIVELNCTFTLSKIPKPKPVLGPDDLLVLLDHHWASCNDNYATERQRIQIAFLLLLVVYTTARPAAILETRRDTTKEDACSEEDSDFLKSKFTVDAIPDSLKYKDVKLFKIDDAEHPDEHIFIVIVTLRLMKGFRNNGSL